LTLIAEKREAKVLMDVADRGYFDVSVAQTIHDVEANKFSTISASFAADRTPERYQNGLKARYKQLREDAEVKFLNMEGEALAAAASAAAKAAAEAVQSSPKETRGSFMQITAALGSVATRLSFNIGSLVHRNSSNVIQGSGAGAAGAGSSQSPTAAANRGKHGSVGNGLARPEGNLTATAALIAASGVSPEGGDSSPSPLRKNHPDPNSNIESVKGSKSRGSDTSKLVGITHEDPAYTPGQTQSPDAENGDGYGEGIDAHADGSTQKAGGGQSSTNNPSAHNGIGGSASQKIADIFSSGSDSPAVLNDGRRKSTSGQSRRNSAGILNWEPSYVAQKHREGANGDLSNTVDAAVRRKGSPGERGRCIIM
jgi:hypothetical protein